MAKVTMICPGCGTRTVMRERCSGCQVFAMARMLYALLKEIERCAESKDPREFVSRTKKTDELFKLNLIGWNAVQKRWVPTNQGKRELERLALSQLLK